MPFRAISLFSGCGGDTLGLERAGGTVVAFSEFNKAATQTHLRNFPHSVHLTDGGSSDITKLPDTVFAQYKGGVDVIFAGFPCFVRDTLVLTNRGYIPIQDVTLDDKLLTHTGSFQRIVCLQKKKHTGTLYDIRLKYHPNVISATKEHPFFVRRIDSSPEWKAIGDIDSGDYFGMFVARANIQYDFIDGKYGWVRAESITTHETNDEIVYNFEVEHDNSYCVENTLVHNCQGVSKAGKKKATDPRNQMFRQFVRATKLIEPKYIIGENVPGLLSMKSGLADTDPLLFDVIRDEFRKIGYDLTYKVLEATEVGVPQKRKRLFIVGWKTGDDMDASSLWASVASWGSSRVMPKLRSFIQPSLDTAHLLTEDTVPDGFDSYALNMDSGAVVTGTPHPFVVLKAGEKLLSCSKRVSPIHSEVISLEHPSKTIICTYDHQPRLLVGLKKDTGRYVRTLFPDELKQIQGFPAEFVLCGNKKEQVVQVGNAVPPALVEAVARALFT